MTAIPSECHTHRETKDGGTDTRTSISTNESCVCVCVHPPQAASSHSKVQFLDADARSLDGIRSSELKCRLRNELVLASTIPGTIVLASQERIW